MYWAEFAIRNAVSDALWMIDVSTKLLAETRNVPKIAREANENRWLDAGESNVLSISISIECTWKIYISAIKLCFLYAAGFER